MYVSFICVVVVANNELMHGIRLSHACWFERLDMPKSITDPPE